LAEAFDGLLTRRCGPLAEPDGRLQALVRLYEREEHPDLLGLAEVLLDIDESLSLWRAHHVQMVERMIGAKRGTGGSDGVAYLQTTLPRRAFPDLWRARSFLGQEPE
jgi:tryptophan 2,3-dioxygenase